MKTTRTPRFPLIIKNGSASVKIYRQLNRGKELFTLAYIGANGRQRENYMDLEKAKREAHARAVSLAQGDLEALRLTGRDKQLYVAACEALRPTGISLDVAAREFARAFEILGGDAIMDAARHYARTVQNGLPEMTVADAVQKLLAAKQGEGISTRYAKDIRLILGRFADAFRVQLKSITADELQSYMASLKMGAVARNNHRRYIVLLFNYAKTQGWLDKSTTTAADALGVANVKEKPVTIYTPKELAKMLACSPERFVPFIALIAFGGLRNDEITEDEPREGQPKGQLQWEHLDFRKGTINVPAAISKTGRKRKIEMTENLRAWLAPYMGNKGFVYGLDPSNDMDATAASAQVPWKRNALRHSFGSYRMEVTKNAGQVALEMGNSAGVVMKHYFEIVDKEDAVAYWSIAPDKTDKVIAMHENAA